MNYKKTTLKNGLRIITVPMKNTQTATVIVAVGAGSRYETEKEAGISHFVEHMFFKGTEKRPNTLAIAETMDSIGGEFNAYTSSDKTAYFAKVDAAHIGTALDVIEIDAASNTSVDNIREIIESVKYKPMMGRYKIFIIDEAHMLSKSAFNALLKTTPKSKAFPNFLFFM